MIDTKRIAELARALDGSPVTQLVITEEGSEIRMLRLPSVTPSHGAGVMDVPIVEESSPTETLVVARRVGIYHKPQRPVHVGDRIREGEIVGFIEAMRIMNEVIAESSGVVTQVFVEDGSPVEFGQELLQLREAGD